MDIIYVAVNGEYEDVNNTYVGTDLKVAVKKWLDYRNGPNTIEIWKNGNKIGEYQSYNSDVMEKKHYSVDEVIADINKYKGELL